MSEDSMLVPLVSVPVMLPWALGVGIVNCSINLVLIEVVTSETKICMRCSRANKSKLVTQLPARGSCESVDTAGTWGTGDEVPGVLIEESG